MSAIAFALAPVGLVAVVCAVLFVGVTIAYARLRLFAPTNVSWLRLVLRETWAQIVVIGWALARRGRTLDSATFQGRPVVLVHGLAADGTSMWGYRRALAARGRPTFAPHLGGMFRSIDKYAVKLIAALERVMLEHPEGEGVDVICHSMGGIVLRATLAVRPDLGARVKHVVTVATPHTGTAGARGLFFPEARQLVVGAEFIMALPPLPDLLPNARFTTVASDADAVVYPSETCAVRGAEHHAMHGIGHAELLVDPGVVDLVVAAVT